MTLRRLLFRLPLLLALLFAAIPAMADGDPSFHVVNRSGQAINEIYVSPTREPYWGRDLLGQDVLPAGQSFPVRLAPTSGCRFDVRVVYADGRPEERRDQDTCQIAEMVFGTAATRGVPGPGPSPGQGPGPSQPQAQAPGASQAANPSFNLVNRGRNAIREVYVSSARDTNWGSDRLGADTLPPGRHLEVRLPLNDCVNDVRIVWMDGRAEERRALDTCRLVNLVFQ